MLAIPSVHVGEEVFSLSANTLRPRFVHSSVASSYAIRFAAGTPPFPGEAEVDIVKVSGPIARTPDELAHATSASAVRVIRIVFIVFDSEPRRVSCIQGGGSCAKCDSEAFDISRNFSG